MITQGELKEHLSYDQVTGLLTWKETKGRIKKGARAGGEQLRGRRMSKVYRSITINRTPYPEHRLVWLYAYGKFPSFQIDHIDGDGTNNILTNLRDVPQSENCKNTKRSRNNTSGVTGVCWSKTMCKWYAKIKVNRKDIYCGSSTDFDTAVALRKAAEKEHGFHPNHGVD